MIKIMIHLLKFDINYLAFKLPIKPFTYVIDNIIEDDASISQNTKMLCLIGQ